MDNPIDLGAAEYTWPQIRNRLLVPEGPYIHFLYHIRSEIGTGKRVLDLGCGDCAFTCMVHEGTLNTVEAFNIVDEEKWTKNSRDMIKLAEMEKWVKFTPGVNAARRMGLPDKGFHVSTAFALLEHVWCPGHHNVIEQMVKAAKEKLVFLIPNMIDRWTIDPYAEGSGHINQFDEERIMRCFGHYPYEFKAYRNRLGMSCFLVIMNLAKPKGEVAVEWI